MMKSNSFSSTQIAKATPSQLWSLYQDVENWNIWDTELEWSKLNGEFKDGTEGQLKSKGSPEVKFVLTDVEELKKFTTYANIPLGKLVIEHHIIEQDHNVEFTHVVYFTGPLSFVFDLILGRTFRKALPNVLVNIKNLLEV